MGGYEVIGVTSVPSFNNSLVNKKYVDDEVAAVTRGISQAQADARYLKLTKYEYDNWMDTFTDMSALAIVWSDHVRKSVIDSDTNLEIRTISVETSLSAAVIKARKIEIYVNYAYTSDVSGVSKILTNAKSLVTIDLSKKSYAAMNYKRIELYIRFTFTRRFTLEMTRRLRIRFYGKLVLNASSMLPP